MSIWKSLLRWLSVRKRIALGHCAMCGGDRHHLPDKLYRYPLLCSRCNRARVLAEIDDQRDKRFKVVKGGAA